MPLFAESTYTSWQLACMLAIEPFGGPNPGKQAEHALMRDELRLRGKGDSEIEEMVALAKRVAAHIRPMVCMDIDDLAFGIESWATGGVIDEREAGRLIDFVKAHVDAPRRDREMPGQSDVGSWAGLNLPNMFGRWVRSAFRRWRG